MVEFNEDPELIGNIKLESANTGIEEAKNDHGFRSEAESTQASTQNNSEPMSTLDEPVSETIVSFLHSI